MFFQKGIEIVGLAVLPAAITHTAAYFLGKKEPKKMNIGDQNWRFGIMTPCYLLSIFAPVANVRASLLLMALVSSHVAAMTEGSHAAYVESHPDTKPSPLFSLLPR